MRRRPVVVVVGAGSAGSVVAGTLAASNSCSVVLLDAGPDSDPTARSRAATGPSSVAAMAEPDRMWDPLPAVRVAGQAPRRYLRGRGIGGSSAVNAMVALEGHPDDYDEWESSFGCAGWGWAGHIRWFDRLRAVHPLTIARSEEIGAIGATLLQSDPRAERALLTRDSLGRRVTAADVFVEPWRGTDGLAVRGDSEVRSILIDRHRAVGVELVDGSVIEADAVIVCAGAIHSPTLLLRSEVERRGIGLGLQDHPSFPVTIELDPSVWPSEATLSVGALLRSTHREPDDLQVVAMEEVDPAAPGIGVLLGAVMRVRSRGVVSLGSDPAGPPEVNFRMLSDERDMAAMRAVVDTVERVAEALASSGVGRVIPHASDDDAIRAAVGDYVHATSTCRMGSLDDDDAVVDPAGAVIGYRGLWVVDASVMPRAPRANTHLPTMALALRLATIWVASVSDG